MFLEQLHELAQQPGHISPGCGRDGLEFGYAVSPVQKSEKVPDLRCNRPVESKRNCLSLHGVKDTQAVVRDRRGLSRILRKLPLKRPVSPTPTLDVST